MARAGTAARIWPPDHRARGARRTEHVGMAVHGLAPAGHPPHRIRGRGHRRRGRRPANPWRRARRGAGALMLAATSRRPRPSDQRRRDQLPLRQAPLGRPRRRNLPDDRHHECARLSALSLHLCTFRSAGEVMSARLRPKWPPTPKLATTVDDRPQGTAAPWCCARAATRRAPSPARPAAGSTWLPFRAVLG